MLLLVGTPPISTQFLLSSGFYETSREARNFYRISRPTGLFALLTAAAAATYAPPPPVASQAEPPCRTVERDFARRRMGLE